jgi:hypothetical protein
LRRRRPSWAAGSARSGTDTSRSSIATARTRRPGELDIGRVDGRRVTEIGDAEFFGDLHALALNGPVVGLVPTATNTGYWLVASDGGVFSFGGSYLMIASDGGTFSFSTAPFFGSLAGVPTPAPIVSGATTG